MGPCLAVTFANSQDITIKRATGAIRIDGIMDDEAGCRPILLTTFNNFFRLIHLWLFLKQWPGFSMTISISMYWE